MPSDHTLEISIPDAFLRLGVDPNDIQRYVREWLVLSLFTDGRISSGKAAQLLGIHRTEFLDLLRVRGISYIDYSPDELADELASVHALKSVKT